MTNRELAHKLLDELPDERLEDALDVIRALDGDRIVDEWGDLSSMTRAAASATMRRLDEQERAAFGETIAEAWGRQKCPITPGQIPIPSPATSTPTSRR